MDPDDALDHLALHARDLVAWARDGDLPPADLRDDDARVLLDALAQRKSVLLVGPDGVGRTSIVRAAARLVAAEGGPRLFELSTNDVLSGTKYLGEWQTKLDGLLAAAEEAGAVLVFTDVWALPTAGRASDTTANMLDQLRPWVTAKRVTLVGEADPARLRAMERAPGLADLFTHQAVEPLDDTAVDEVLARAATRLGLDLPPDGRQALVDLTRRFLPARPQPGPALDLLGRVHDYQTQKAGIDEHEPADPAFIEKVFAIYAGLPRFVVSRSSTRRASEIRAWFEDRIVGQPEAIEAVVEAIALFKSGLADPKRPLGTFLFVGPTGVGKTELAKALASFLFGSPHRLLRFDLGEFKDPSSFARLLGDPHRPSEPALLVDAVRAQPFQVVLFDELEKAHPNLFDTLLGILDEGRVTTPRGEVVDLRSCFVVCTSNVGAVASERSLGFSAGTDAGARRERLVAALQDHFRPEFLGRFQHVVTFHPLAPEQVRAIARHAVRDVLEREGITSRNLVVEVDDGALDLLVEHGFDPRWGARGLQREVQRRIVLPLAMTLMEHRVEEGQVLKLTAIDGRMRVRRVDTEASREARREAEPIRLDGRRWSRADLEDSLRRLRDDLEALHLAAGHETLAAEHAELLAEREDPAFWSDGERAARTLRDLDLLGRRVGQLDRLRTRVDEIGADLETAASRRELAAITQRVDQTQRQAASAWRTLVHMGPDGHWDALVEVRPLGRDGADARDFVSRLYLDWAEHRKHEIVWLHDPRLPDDPAMFAIRGPHAFGMLQLEAGVHKVRDGDATSAARVRVAPWHDRTRPVVFADHRALKAIGHLGGKIRSRLACEGGLVLQNGNTLAANRDLAVDVSGPWAEAPAPVDAIIRRFDLAAPLMRDALTGETSGRPDAVAPERLHELLCRRLEVAAGPLDAA